MTDLISVTVSDGKYTIQQTAPGTWEALRYGEEWPAFRDSGPDNLHVALAYEVAALRGALRGVIDDLEIRAKNGVVDCSHGVYCSARAIIDNATKIGAAA